MLPIEITLPSFLSLTRSLCLTKICRETGTGANGICSHIFARTGQSFFRGIKTAREKAEPSQARVTANTKWKEYLACAFKLVVCHVFICRDRYRRSCDDVSRLLWNWRIVYSKNKFGLPSVGGKISKITVIHRFDFKSSNPNKKQSNQPAKKRAV